MHSTKCLLTMQGKADKIVAIKCILRSRLNKVSTDNLFTEIKVMKELNHDHIVKLEDFEASSGMCDVV